MRIPTHFAFFLGLGGEAGGGVTAIVTARTVLGNLRESFIRKYE